MSDTENNSDTGNDSDTGTISTTKPKSNTLSIVSTIAIWGFILALFIMVILMLVFGYQKDLPKRMFPETDIEGDLIVQGKLARYNDNVVVIPDGSNDINLTTEDSGKTYVTIYNETTNTSPARNIILPNNANAGVNYKVKHIALSDPAPTGTGTLINATSSYELTGLAIVGNTGTGMSIWNCKSGNKVFKPSDNSGGAYSWSADVVSTGVSWYINTIASTVSAGDPFASG